jgi:DMSO/TMAO reductase YedYZ molybdopterin-dependent catalytic subunit
MNGHELTTGHGAPVRLRVARQLGYKKLKYLSCIMVVDTVKNIGKGLGGAEDGFSLVCGHLRQFGTHLLAILGRAACDRGPRIVV